MALLHRAELHPTKLELLAAWLPSRRWYQGVAGADVERVAACQAEEFMEVEGRLERREPAMTVTGSGVHGAEMQAVGALRRVVDEDPTLVVTDAVELTVVRIVDGDSRPAGATLTGTWAGSPRAGAVGVCAAELDQTVTPSGLPLRLCASMPLGLPAVSLVNSSLEEGSWPSCCTRRRRPSMATSPGRPATCRG